MNKSPITRLELPAESQNESFARIFAASYSAMLYPTLEELADIKTVISEAVTNAVVHAYPGKKGVIHILARVVDGDTLEFTVKDKGTGIENVEKAMEPLFTTVGGERAGLGFAVMESFMDKVKVNSVPGKGTTVVMDKKIVGKR